MEDITPPDSVAPVYLIPLTDEEEVERARWAQEALDVVTAEEAKAVAKESAKAKLAALGLTEEEVTALLN